ncbi:MAG: phosphoglycerate kinase [Ferroplasma sp.]|uniref:phosphoglycerate kinase n=1 Tax=Ferroplasma sp. TaxID=2591003 RepID=UPI0028159AE0|nr:phosphoglycerate kinase [Ferroplasma sp.]WMT52193.1 MAG: phosphoglycerate kinase [Ferroplasma sp.]
MDTFPFYTMNDFDFTGKRVYLRIDINSPINPINGEILDDTRFRHHIQTINELKNSKLVIVAHQGRPGDSDFVSLHNHARHLEKLIGRDVIFVDSLIGSAAEDRIRRMKTGDIIMLENSRFYSEEVVVKDEENSLENTHIIKTLSQFFDYYVIDAFAAIHRAQATLTGFRNAGPNIAGRLMENEVRNIETFKTSNVHPKLAILGGSKITDAIQVARPFLENHIVDDIILGGVVANIFLWASGVDIGLRNKEFIMKHSKNYETLIEDCKYLLSKYRKSIHMPVDFVLNPSGDRINSGDHVPEGELIADIGMESVANFSKIIGNAKNIFLNGPMGMYEINEYSLGTRELFNDVAQSNASKIVGGGHTINAINEFSLTRSMGYISTGGGALINYLSGESIPVIESLIKNREIFGGN